MTRRSETLLLAGIVVTGIATVILGAALPMLQLRYGVSEAELGRLFAAQFAGGALAATLSLRRPRFSIIGGFQFIALGIAAAGFASWQFAPLAVLFYGIGLGLVIPSANMAVALARENTRGASLSVLNLAWGLGAAATPILLLAARGGHLLTSIYLLVSALAEIIGIVLWFTFKSFPQARATDSPGTESFDPRILVHGLGFLLYIGAEGCVGGWTSEYVFRTFASPHFATAAIAGFWIGLLVGRGAAPAILRQISEARLLRVSLALALSGVIVMFAAPTALVVTLGTLMVGLGMASIYGLQVSNATTYAERRRAKIPGWLFTCGSIGGATLPWLFGIVAEKTTLRSALLLPIAALVFLITLSARTSPTQVQAAD
jgi:MFS transporter, FHS family, glucose/mannose:H+ symporter